MCKQPPSGSMLKGWSAAWGSSSLSIATRGRALARAGQEVSEYTQSMPRLLLSLALFLLVAPPAQSEDSGGESDLNTSLRVQLSWSVEGAQVHSVRWDRRPPEQRSGAVEDRSTTVSPGLGRTEYGGGSSCSWASCCVRTGDG